MKSPQEPPAREDANQAAGEVEWPAPRVDPPVEPAEPWAKLVDRKVGEEFVEWKHYPPDDVRDSNTHAQFFFHAHAPDDRERPDYAHFHTFMGAGGMPSGVRPAELDGYCPPSAEDGAAMSHLVAISMTPTGMPERLFTTNRWVTTETWYRAPDAIAMLDGFAVGGARPLYRWITSMMVLFRPQIERLLHERDAEVDRWRAAHPGTDVFEDRRLEITSSIDISLETHIECLDARLEGGK